MGGRVRRLSNRFIRWQYARMERMLRTANAADLAAAGERRVAKVFRAAARDVPAYRAMLAARGVDPGAVTSVAEFQARVPILDKQSLFNAHDLSGLCRDGRLDGVRLLYSSSGHSQTFSFGMDTWAGTKSLALGLEFLLQLHFRALDRPTLLVNCLPMGVKIHTRTLPLIESSVRADVVWALLRKLRGEFEQVVLIGEHLFLKRLIEGGPGHGVDWQAQTVHVVTGGEYIPESFRAYLGGLLGHDPDQPEQGMIGINFGMSELSVSLLLEHATTVRIRRLAWKDREFRRALYGRDTTMVPCVMQYFPSETFMETVPSPQGRNELIVTMLDPTRKLPVIRYNTHDVVDLMSHGKIADVLRRAGREDLIPPYSLPVAVAWGKCAPLARASGEAVYPEQVKEALYHDPLVGAGITGNFRLQDGAHRPLLRVQMSPDSAGLAPEELAERLKAVLPLYVPTDVDLQLLAYRQFPYGFEHDFERKNQYLAPGQ